MKLEQPFKGIFPISQHFGENLNGFYKADGLLGHSGIDFACPMGTPIISPCNGTVIAVSTDIQKGEGVSVLSDDTFQWNGQDCKLDCVMWHLKDKSILVKVGDKVTTGQLLGLSNNTGQSTGPHLHFSTIPLATDGSRRGLADGNGYNSCVDPLPYLNLVKQIITLKKGMSGEDISNLQAQLNKRGYNLVIDGKFGQKTLMAVVDFQTKNGLAADGICGRNTQAKLYENI